ncbi:MAG: molecular chaperone GrpE [Myxococcota bacterium]|jgi:molecular chaperone GrpE
MSDSKDNIKDDATDETVANDTVEVVEEVIEVVEDLEYFKDKFLRAQADVQNMRRRMHDETEERVRLRLESLLNDLMRVADYLEVGLNAVPQSVQEAEQGEAFLTGMSAIQQALDMVFVAHGVMFISPAASDAFDPEKHEAVETVEDLEIEAPQLELLNRGYRMANKILRPAKVRVITNVSSD